MTFFVIRQAVLIFRPQRHSPEFQTKYKKQKLYLPKIEIIHPLNVIPWIKMFHTELSKIHV